MDVCILPTYGCRIALVAEHLSYDCAVDYKMRNDESVRKMMKKLRIKPDLNRVPTDLDQACGMIVSSTGSVID